MRLLLVPLLLALAVSASACAGTRTAAQQTLFFDAVFTHTGTVGSPADQVGHQQIASGLLDDRGGRAIGHFAFNCRWIATLAGGDAREHCTGWGQTREGRIIVAGPSRRSDLTHTWTISGGSRAYKGAHGTVVVRDLGQSETLVTMTITPRTGIVLRTAVLRLPPANDAFRGRAGTLCAAAAKQLAALPPFPFSNFNPLHPNPKLLPKVGQFFTGPADPRPTLRALNAQLRALGQPPADTNAWARVLAARTAALAVNSEQDRAALAANTAAFANSVHDVDKTQRHVAITATIFGVTDCVL